MRFPILTILVEEELEIIVATTETRGVLEESAANKLKCIQIHLFCGENNELRRMGKRR